MQVSIIFMRQKLLNVLTSSREITSLFVRQCQIEFITTVRRIDLVRSLKRRNRFAKASLLETEFPELMVRLETLWRGSQSSTQLCFCFTRRTARMAFRTLRFQRGSIAGKGLAGTQARIRPMSAHRRPVCDTSDGEIWLVCKCHRFSRGRQRSVGI